MELHDDFRTPLASIFRQRLGDTLASELSARLSGWRKPAAVHDPGKVVLDLVLAIAAGGDCLADVSLIRAQPELFILTGHKRLTEIT